MSYPSSIENARIPYLIDSFNSAPALNLTLLRAAISMVCFVCGLMPLRAAFSEMEKEPNPNRATLPPAFNSLDTVSMKASTAFSRRLC